MKRREQGLSASNRVANKAGRKATLRAIGKIVLFIFVVFVLGYIIFCFK